jgi:GcrA cell cycle regulator
MEWTDERVELLRRLWLDGKSASQISDRLGGGLSRNACIGKIHRLGLGGRGRAPSGRPSPATTTSPPAAAVAAVRVIHARPARPPRESGHWDAARVEILRAGWGFKPIDELIVDLGRGGKAIRAKARAIGLPPPGMLDSSKAINDLRRKRGAEDSARWRAIFAGEARGSGGVTIVDLAERGCRWPLGDPRSAEFRYCGALHAPGEGPYCCGHSQLAEPFSASKIEPSERRRLAAQSCA